MSSILIVEDSQDMRDLVSGYLQAEGHSVTSVKSGKEGLRIVADLKPDLIVSDIMMPGLDGFGVFEAVRSDPRTASIPVVFLTAMNDRETLLRALRAGVDDFVSKPFQRAELVSVVARRLHAGAGTEAQADPWTLKGKSTAKPAAPPARREPRSEYIPKPRPAAPAGGPEATPAPESPLQLKPEPPLELKPEPKPAPKPEPKPEPKTEPKPKAESAPVQVAAKPAAAPAPVVPPPVVPAGIINPEARVRFSLTDTALTDIAAAVSRRETRATLLIGDVRGFQKFREGLSGIEVIEVLTQFFLTTRETVTRQGGWMVKFLGDGFAAVFEDDPDQEESQQVRALKAALLIVLAAQRLKPWLRTRFPNREFPPFAVGIGVHTGPVSVGTLPKSSAEPYTIAGETVELCARLEQLTKEFGWSIVASQATFLGAAEVLALGRGAMTPKPGQGEPLMVAEVRGPLQEAAGSQEQLKVFSLIEAAVESNTTAIVAAG